MLFKVIKLIILIITFILTLTGCNQQQSSSFDFNISNNKDFFINKLDVNNNGQDTKFNPHLINLSNKNFEIFNSNGEKIKIDFTKNPVIISAYWCPSCQRELVMLNKNKDKLSALPIFVNSGFNNKDIKSAVNITKQEIDELNLNNFSKIYYMLNPPNEIISEYPTLLFPKNNKIYGLSGEHSIDILIQALKS